MSIDNGPSQFSQADHAFSTDIERNFRQGDVIYGLYDSMLALCDPLLRSKKIQQWNHALLEGILPHMGSLEGVLQNIFRTMQVDRGKSSWPVGEKRKKEQECLEKFDHLMSDPIQRRAVQEYLEKCKSHIKATEQYAKDPSYQRHIDAFLEVVFSERGIREFVKSTATGDATLKKLCKIGLTIFSKEQQVHFALPQEASIAEIAANSVVDYHLQSQEHFLITFSELKQLSRMIDNPNIRLYFENGREIPKDDPGVRALLTAFQQAREIKAEIRAAHSEYTDEELRHAVKQKLLEIDRYRSTIEGRLVRT